MLKPITAEMSKQLQQLLFQVGIKMNSDTFQARDDSS